MKKTFILSLTIALIIFSLSSIKAQNATNEANGVRERVREKIEAAKQNPKAYIGSVTDKTEDTLQIQNDSGEIQFISIEPDSASFAKIDKKTTSAKYDDIGIGDYIISMGFTNDDNVLEAKRVVITSQASATDRKVIFGHVSSVDRKQVEVNSQGNNYLLDFPRRWKGPEIAELEIGMGLIAVGQIDDNTITIRTIHITSENSSGLSSQ